MKRWQHWMQAPSPPALGSPRERSFSAGAALLLWVLPALVLGCSGTDDSESRYKNKVENNGSGGMTFVPDPNHEWTLEDD